MTSHYEIGHEKDDGEVARSATAADPLCSPDPLDAHLATSVHYGASDAGTPEVRIGQRWFSILWLLPISFVGLLIGIAVAQQLRTYAAVQQFIQTSPGQGSFQPPVYDGFPLWLRIMHFLNLFFILFIIRAGLQILADHPRLQFDAGSTPGKEWRRLRGPVPADRMAQEPPERAWTAKDDAVSLPSWIGLPGLRHTIGLARWWHFSFDLLWLINGLAF
jgi:hypothetical protein